MGRLNLLKLEKSFVNELTGERYAKCRFCFEYINIFSLEVVTIFSVEDLQCIDTIECTRREIGTLEQLKLHLRIPPIQKDFLKEPF